jgi:hypothetical protein
MDLNMLTPLSRQILQPPLRILQLNPARNPRPQKPMIEPSILKRLNNLRENKIIVSDSSFER